MRLAGSYIRGETSLIILGTPKWGKNLSFQTEKNLRRVLTRGPNRRAQDKPWGKWGSEEPALTTAGLFVTLVRAVQEAITAFREQDAGLTVLTLELPAHTGQSATCGWNTGKGPWCTKGLSCLEKVVCILWTIQFLLHDMPLEWWEVTPCRHCNTLHWNLPSWQARVMKESNKLEFKSWLYKSLSKLLNGTHVQLLFVKWGNNFITIMSTRIQWDQAPEIVPGW